MAPAAQAHNDPSLLIPTPTQNSGGPESARREAERLVCLAINGMVELANRHGAGLPFINVGGMIVSQPRQEVILVQSRGHIFSFNATRGTLSVDGRQVMG